MAMTEDVAMGVPPPASKMEETGVPMMGASRTIGKYIIGETLGQGGFSKVKLGFDPDTKQKVALKILKKDQLKLKGDVVKQVQREVLAMQKIQHTNVIKLVDVNWDAKYPKKKGPIIDVVLIVLELATGGELFEFLSFTGSFEESIARTYFRQLIEGVESCHAQNVVHRDLKPENLLLDDSFVLKIADFGLSSMNGASLLMSQCGTPGYQAPEVLLQSGYDAQLADIWSCGVILFIMLAGFPPLQRPTQDDWWFNKLCMKRHDLFWQAHSRSAYFSDLTKDFINKLLVPDPQQRMNIAAIKNHPWYKGAVIGQNELQRELERRKKEVDDQKMREKLKKATVITQDDAFRGMGPTPSITYMRTPSNGLDAEPASESDSKLQAPALPNDVRACKSAFASRRPAMELLVRIGSALGQLGSAYVMKKSEFKIKCTTKTDLGTMTTTFQFYTDPNASDMTVCYVRRMQGDTMQFWQFYKDVLSEVHDILDSTTTYAV